MPASHCDWPDDLLKIEQQCGPAPSLQACCDFYNVSTSRARLADFYKQRHRLILAALKQGGHNASVLSAAGHSSTAGNGTRRQTTLERALRQDNGKYLVKLEYYIFKHSGCNDLKALYAWQLLTPGLFGRHDAAASLGKSVLPGDAYTADHREIHPLLVMVELIDLPELAAALFDYQVACFREFDRGGLAENKSSRVLVSRTAVETAVTDLQKAVRVMDVLVADDVDVDPAQRAHRQWASMHYKGSGHLMNDHSASTEAQRIQLWLLYTRTDHQEAEDKRDKSGKADKGAKGSKGTLSSDTASNAVLKRMHELNRKCGDRGSTVPTCLLEKGDETKEALALPTATATKGNPPLDYHTIGHVSRGFVLAFNSDAEAMVELLSLHGVELRVPRKNGKLWATWATGPGKDGTTSDSVAREANADVAYKLGQAFRITIGLPPSAGCKQPADACADRVKELRLRACAAFRFGFSTLFMLQVMAVTFLRDIDALKMEAGIKEASELPEEAREEAGHGISAYVRVLLPSDPGGRDARVPMNALLEDIALCIDTVNSGCLGTEVGMSTNKQGGYKQKKTSRSAARKHWDSALGCLNLSHLTLIIGILDTVLGGFEIKEDFTRTTRAIVKKLFHELGYKFSTVGGLSLYSAGRSSGIYEFKHMEQWLDQLMELFMHSSDICDKCYLTRCAFKLTLAGQPVDQDHLPDPSKIGSKKSYAVPTDDDLVLYLRERLREQSTPDMLLKYAAICERFNVGTVDNPVTPAAVDLQHPRLGELIALLLKPPYTAKPRRGGGFDMSVALSKVLPAFHAGFLGTRDYTIPTEVFPYVWMLETWGAPGWEAFKRDQLGAAPAPVAASRPTYGGAGADGASTSESLLEHSLGCKVASTPAQASLLAKDLVRRLIQCENTTGVSALFSEAVELENICLLLPSFGPAHKVVLRCAVLRSLPDAAERQLCLDFVMTPAAGHIHKPDLEQEAPEQEAPVEEAPEQEAPVQEAPEQEAPVEEAPVEEAPEQEAPVEEAPEQEAVPEVGREVLYTPALVSRGRKRRSAAITAEAAFRDNHAQFEATGIAASGVECEMPALSPQAASSAPNGEPAPKVPQVRAGVVGKVGKACPHHGPYAASKCPVCNALSTLRCKHKVPTHVRIEAATPGSFRGAREAAVLQAHPEAARAKSVWDWVLDHELARRP